MKSKTELELTKLELEIACLKAEAKEYKKSNVVKELETKKLNLETQALEDNYKLKAHRNRVFTLNDDIDEYVYRSLGEFIALLTEPGEIRLNSPGGSVIDGLGIYDLIVKSEFPITTNTAGMAASMAGVILQSGSWRVMSPNSFILIHEVSSLSWGKLNDIKNEFEFLKRLQERCFTILATKSKLTVAEITDKTKGTDWWLSASEALDLGLIDEIN